MNTASRSAAISAEIRSKNAAAWVRRYPVTIVLGSIVAGVGFFNLASSQAEMDRLMARYGVTWASLSAHRFWTLPVSTFLQSDPGYPWIILFFVLTAVFALETVGGSLAAFVTFIVSDWISAPATAATLRLLSALGSHEAQRLLDAGSTGSSAAFHGCFAAGIAMLPRVWAQRLFALFVGIVAIEFVFERLDDSIAHAIATVVGLLLARFVWVPRRERQALARHPN